MIRYLSLASSTVFVSVSACISVLISVSVCSRLLYNLQPSPLIKSRHNLLNKLQTHKVYPITQYTKSKLAKKQETHGTQPFLSCFWSLSKFKSNSKSCSLSKSCSPFGPVTSLPLTYFPRLCYRILITLAYNSYSTTLHIPKSQVPISNLCLPISASTLGFCFFLRGLELRIIVQIPDFGYFARFKSSPPFSSCLKMPVFCVSFGSGFCVGPFLLLAQLVNVVSVASKRETAVPIHCSCKGSRPCRRWCGSAMGIRA